MFFFLVNWVMLQSLIRGDIIGEMTRVPTVFAYCKRSYFRVRITRIHFHFDQPRRNSIPIHRVNWFFALLTGRLFCGWVCPTGFVCDVLADVAGENKKLSAESDKAAKKFKFILLFIMFILFIPLGVYLKTDFVKHFDYSQALGDLVNNPVSVFSLSEFIFATLPNTVKDIIDTQGIGNLFDKDNPAKGIIFIVWCIVLGINVFYPRFYCKYVSICCIVLLLRKFLIETPN